MSTQTAEANATSTTTADMATILLLSLNKEGFWDEQHSGLVDALASKARLKRVVKATVAKPEFDAIRDKLVKYVRDGGIAVMCTHSSTFVQQMDLSQWFRGTWQLPWEQGDYHRTTVHLNPEACDGRLAGIGLPAQYSQNAVSLENVAEHATVYLPSDASMIEIAVFGPDPVDVRQAPVAFERVGSGWLGYVEDVNTETPSQAVILAMCGL